MVRPELCTWRSVRVAIWHTLLGLYREKFLRAKTSLSDGVLEKRDSVSSGFGKPS